MAKAAWRQKMHWICIALVYLLISSVIGILALIYQSPELGILFAAVLTGGFIVPGLIGILYLFFPGAASRMLGLFSFWLYHAGFLILLVGAALLLYSLAGTTETSAVIAIGSSFLSMGLLLFVLSLIQDFNGIHPR